MKEAKEYKFKISVFTLAFELICTAIFLVLLLLLLVNLYINPLALLLVATIPAALCYIQFYVVCVIFQYNKYDKGKKVIIDADRATLTVLRGDQSITIKKADVEKVELYEQKSLGRFGTYNYMVIYTTDKREILLTKFTIRFLLNDNIIATFLSKKPRFYFKKGFNYIDEKKFKS